MKKIKNLLLLNALFAAGTLSYAQESKSTEEWQEVAAEPQRATRETLKDLQANPVYKCVSADAERGVYVFQKVLYPKKHKKIEETLIAASEPSVPTQLLRKTYKKRKKQYQTGITVTKLVGCSMLIGFAIYLYNTWYTKKPEVVSWQPVNS